MVTVNAAAAMATVRAAAVATIALEVEVEVAAAVREATVSRREGAAPCRAEDARRRVALAMTVAVAGANRRPARRDHRRRLARRAGRRHNSGRQRRWLSRS